MSLDGFLTFFGLLIAGYAVLDPVTRLRLRVDAPIQLTLIVLALTIILPFEFITPILGVLPEKTASWLVAFDFGQPLDLLTNSHIAFIATLTWSFLAWLSFNFSKPRAWKLSRLIPLIERLHDEGRYLELIELVEPYLPILQNVLKIEEKENKNQYKIPIFSKSIRKSTKNKYEHSKSIVDLISKSRDVRFLLQCVKPKFAANFFTSFYGTHQDWLSYYIIESMENKESHLRKDIQRTVNTSGIGYHFDRETILLPALIGDANFAAKIHIWKPVGDVVTKEVKENTAYQKQLLRAPPQDENDLFGDITYSAIHFFDILIRQAAQQQRMDHMWLPYLYHFVNDMEIDGRAPVVPGTAFREFSTLRENLVSEALATLMGWVELETLLPDGNAHKIPKSIQEAKDAVTIPYWAARTLCNTLRVVLFSSGYTKEFKAECVNSFMRTVTRQLSSDSYMRPYLAHGLINGTSGTASKSTLTEMNSLRDLLDLTILSEFSELSELMREIDT